MKLFEGYHADLYEAGFWVSLQARIAAGEPIDILPYGPGRQLRQ